VSRPWALESSGADAQQFVAVSDGEYPLVGDVERLAKLGDVPVLAAQVGVRPGDGLKLDEAPEPGNLVEMDADVAPQQQPARLLDGDENAERSREDLLQRFGILDREDAILAFPLDGVVGPLVIDQLSGVVLLAQLSRPCATRK
jgi:hypothetical protein